MIFSDHSVHLASKTNNDISKDTVIHIHTSLPYNLAWVDTKLVSLLDMIVKKCRKQIVRRCNCMKISCKMKI